METKKAEQVAKSKTTSRKRNLANTAPPTKVYIECKKELHIEKQTLVLVVFDLFNTKMTLMNRQYAYTWSQVDSV